MSKPYNPKQRSNRVKRPQQSRNHNFVQKNNNNDRGNVSHKQALQMRDKYTAQARDASSSGSRVDAENFLQHAEHYQRIISYFEEKNKEQQQKEQRENKSTENKPTENKQDSVNQDKTQEAKPEQNTPSPKPRKAPKTEAASKTEEAPKAEESKPSPITQPDENSSNPEATDNKS